MVKYNINTKHGRDSETRFPYVNPSPCNTCNNVIIRFIAMEIRINTKILRAIRI